MLTNYNDSPKTAVPNKEPEIPRRLDRLFNDMQELRETVMHLGSRLDPIMSLPNPKPAREGSPRLDPTTGLGSRVSDINGIVDDTRSILADMLDRLEL